MTRHHPSVKALLDVTGSDDPELAVRARARRLVAKALRMGWKGPPFSMNQLASLRGLKVDLNARLLPDQDACVVPGRILINRQKPPVRKRFSVAHEIAHTLFPGYEDDVRSAGRLWRSEGDDSELERLCQLAAAEFMFPLPSFRAQLESGGDRLESIFRLAETFAASPEATARRIVEVSETEMLVVIARPLDTKTSDWFDFQRDDSYAPYVTLAVSSAAASPKAADVVIPYRTTPPDESAVVRAWKRVFAARGRVVIEQTKAEVWEHAGLLGRWDCEAVTLPKASKSPRQVLAFMRRTEKSAEPV